MAFKIRLAVPEDCGSICDLIQELADYEKYPDGPKLKKEDLIRDGFGSKPFFKAFVAEIDDTIVGYALYFFTYSTWEGRVIYMEDLYVTQKQRKKGIGMALWKAVAEEGLKYGCCRLDFAVLKWNVPSIKFYESKGAINMTESDSWNLFRLNKEAMQNLCST